MENTPGQAPEAPKSYDTDGAAEVLLERFHARQEKEEEPADESAEESPDEPVDEAPDEGQAEDTEPAVSEVEEEVEWDGERFKVKGTTPKKLRDALLRQADYTRKTMELAEQRKAVEARSQASEAQLRLREATLEKRAELFSLQGEYQKLINQDWDALTDANPLEAIKGQQKLKQLEARASAVLAEIGRTEQQVKAWQTQQTQQQIQQALRHGHEVLMRDVPGWNKDTASKLIDYGKSQLGYTADEMDSVYDPRFVKALHKARLYDELQAKRPQVTKRVADAPKTLKPGSGNQQNPGKTRQDEADARLRKSGRLDDAANAILARITKGR